MKKTLFLSAIAALLCASSLNAQDSKLFRYQGEVDLRYTFGLDDETHNVSLEMVNGVRFNRYLFAGAGIGIGGNTSEEAAIIPIYAEVKGYLPVARKLDLIAAIDLGTRLDFSYGTSGHLLLRPEFGIHIPFGEKTGMDITLVYECYSYEIRVQDTKISDALNQFGLKVGFHF